MTSIQKHKAIPYGSATQQKKRCTANRGIKGTILATVPKEPKKKTLKKAG
jgi:hypothetical protein